MEPEMDRFLDELVPAARGTLAGATDEDIDRIEALAGLPLPRFYRWFLSRMGLNMGPFGYRARGSIRADYHLLL